MILFAIVAVVAANPEPERERRGVLAAPVVAAHSAWAVGPSHHAAPAVAIAAAPRVVAARKYITATKSPCLD